jgi:putative membrane protein
MNTVLLVIGSIFVVLAAVLHVYIFVLESVRWISPRTWKIFGVESQEQAEVIRPMAFNQGFYNLFLGVVAGVGVGIHAASPAAGIALIFAGAGSMLLAALVLLLSSTTNRRSALVQGTLPFIGLVFFALALVA